jgi:hypothetical protein
VLPDERHKVGLAQPLFEDATAPLDHTPELLALSHVQWKDQFATLGQLFH